MKVNSTTTIKTATIAVFSFFIGLAISQAIAIGDEPSVVHDVRCVKINEDQTQQTIFEREGVLEVKTSNRDGDIVLTLIFSKDGNEYELVPMDNNILCSTKSRIEVK